MVGSIIRPIKSNLTHEKDREGLIGLYSLYVTFNYNGTRPYLFHADINERGQLFTVGVCHLQQIL